MVKVGYGTPKAARYLHPSGLMEKLVSNPSDLEGLDPKVNVVRIARTVGSRKRAQIGERAEKLGLKILNLRRVKKSESK